MNHFDVFFKNSLISVDVDENGLAWFRASEIASVLGYTRAVDMTKHLPANERLCQLGTTPTGPQEVIMINEFGLYRIIMKATSRRPEAKEFQNWIVREVIPCIRRFGAYISPETREILERNPELITVMNAKITELERQNQMTQLYRIIDKTRYLYSEYENARTYINENQQFINTGKAVTAPGQYISINGLSKLLQNFNYPTGSHRLFEELRNDGFLMKAYDSYNYPSQKSLNLGVICLCYNSCAEATDHGVPYYIPMVTPSGINFFINYFLNKMQLFQPIMPIVPVPGTMPVSPEMIVPTSNVDPTPEPMTISEQDTNTESA